MTGFSTYQLTRTGSTDCQYTDTDLTYCDTYESVTSNGDYKPEKVIKEKTYIKAIEKLKLNPLPEHRHPVLKRKTVRSLIAPLANKGWKQRR